MSEQKEEINKAEPASDSTVDQLKSELEKAKKDYLYLMAEFDTYRRNAIKERSDLTKYGSEKFIRDFLGVFDNFERALQSAAKDENLSSFRDGVSMIASELKSLLQRFGVEEVKTEGEPFDPSKHEAVTNEPREDVPVGHVATVFKKAYKMHDKLIRPAQVTVASAPPTKN